MRAAIDEVGDAVALVAAVDAAAAVAILVVPGASVCLHRQNKANWRHHVEKYQKLTIWW